MYRSIILLVVLLFFAVYSGAQDNNDDYKDTAAVYPDSVETREIAEEPVQQDADGNYAEYIPDTVLVSNQLYTEPDSVVALKNTKSFAYAKNLDSLLYEYQKTLETGKAAAGDKLSWLDRFFLSPVTKYFFWILAGFFVSFILYKLFFAEGFFQPAYAKTNVTVLPGESEGLSKHTNYGKLINQAVVNKNYRLAVRYHYLQTLQMLSSKDVIEFAADKTNYQYLGELSGKTYKNAFASLTRHYEYVWYGGFEVDQPVFNEIQIKFRQFNSGV